MKRFTDRLKKVLMIAVMWIVSTLTSFAQHMHMSEMKETGDQKNVFIGIMDTMMKKMEEVPKGQAAAITFVSQMIPHHEGAIAMADYEIKHGHNFEMIQLAKSIKAEQQSELVQMNLLLQHLEHPGMAPKDLDKEFDKSMAKMMAAMPADNLLKDTDHAFARIMLPHHEAAVDMARVLLKYTHNDPVSAFARQLISNEQIEIEQMSTYINEK